MAATATVERTPSARSKGAAQPARPRVPFVRAAHRHDEGAFADISTQMVAGTVQINPQDIPSYGFLADLWIIVTGSGGVLGAGVLHADYPWNVIHEVSLTTPNGKYLVYPLGGYQWYLTNLIGGYVFNQDPAAAPDYVGTINCDFALRIPVQITPWDAFGALANQNSKSAYKVNITLASIGEAFSTAPTTAPLYRIRYYLDAWSAPSPVDLLGQPQEVYPPALGTTQFWTPYVPVVAAAQQQVRHTRVGNLIRNIVYVARTTAAGTPRSDTVFPDPITIEWDSANLRANIPLTKWKREFFEKFGVAPPAGVIALCLTDDQDGHAGFENRHLWLPTVQATRLDITGVFGAAGTLEILTNDVAVTPLGR